MTARVKKSETAGPEAVDAAAALQATASLIDRMVVFRLAGQRYGLPIESVQEIQQIVAFSEVPGGSEIIIGMVNLRGAVIPALDIRRLVGLEREEYHVDTPMIICRLDGDTVALLVDEVEDVVVLPEDCMVAPPKLHALSDKMIGVCRLGESLVYLLDVDRLVAPVDLEVG